MKFKPLVPTLTVIAALVAVLTPIAWAGGKSKVIYNFTGGANGGPPDAALVLDSIGNLYGPAGGGTGMGCEGFPCGIVFKMTRERSGKWSEGVVLNFSTYFNEGGPESPLAFDGQGNLYGRATGGRIGYNWVYQLTPGADGWGFNLIYQTYDPDFGGVIADGADNLYGSLGKGVNYEGAVGELSPTSGVWVYTDLHDNCDSKGNCPGGEAPLAPFSWDAKGNLYGADNAGGLACPGTYGCGVAFQMTPNGDGTWKYHVLHRFGSFKKDGLYPWGGLAVDASGNAYGTTYQGGPHGYGTVFKLTPAGGGRWKERLLYGFPHVNLGAWPWGNLVFDKAGNVYGVANSGISCGAYFCGQVFKLTPRKSGPWKYSVVHMFQGPDGAYPYGVVIDKKGNLFGTAWGGGKYGYGVVFEVTP